MDTSRVLELIRKYLSRIDTPCKGMERVRFEKASYSKWAINEIIERIIFEADKLPPHITGEEPISHIEIIEDFADEMAYFTDYSSDNRKRFIFLVARDTAYDLLGFVKGELNVENESFEDW